MWPGYVSAVDVFEGGLYLQVDVASRVLRTDTVLDMLNNLAKTKKPTLKEEAEKALLGQSVVTKYNNKNYKIDAIDYNDSPKGTFVKSDGTEMDYMTYYKRQYGITIKDASQPMLIHRPKVKGLVEGETERIIKFVPELCFMVCITIKVVHTEFFCRKKLFV